MEIEFLKTKNNLQTVKINSLLLHSLYNPEAEAERFTENLKLPFIPQNLIIIEPGLEYCTKFLRKKFPETKLISVRLCDELLKYTEKNSFDLEFSSENNFSDFKKFLNSLSDKEIFNTLFAVWTPSEKIFKTQISNLQTIIKNFYEKSKTLLLTSEYFEKKWLLNSCKFVSNAKNIIQLNKIKKDILICASGPSLKNVIPEIKNNRNKLFVLCLSSALSALLNQKIFPDLVMSTDGGYWAGEHLKYLTKTDIPLALTTEAFCPSLLLSKQNILPLCYEDGISAKLLKDSNIPFLRAKRNGTVSGTALEFAIENISDGKKIFFAGLDLSVCKNFQHTQPNELEKNNCLKDNFLNTCEKRQIPQSFKNSSLDLYLSWFQNQNFSENKIFRIIENCEKNNNLNKIKDISLNDFKNIMEKTDAVTENYFYKINYELNRSKLKEIHKNLINLIKQKEVIEQIFPITCLSIEHNSENLELKDKLKNETDKIIKKAGKYFHE